ncbi:hypothetical protein Acsp03_45000 [Actinomadura sp. NBRC 104412]|uniref:hypothetical protein n=1 Tax=Actinomadura sp. NBRC 104412 TaxID=3032203 RepID=UPI0024A488DA|nr:hypothetical protein [Actinomadura sp. NBRC 104412]GLZ07034.1 hypothetical protein Acsp03_45000 [Actinomadura sp. NBRC 104412]
MEPPKVEFRHEDLELLRRFMVGDMEGLAALEGDPEDARMQAVWWLFISAFTVAVRRRFGESFTRNAIIEFVAELRISMGKDRDELDPKVAEDWIRNALDNLPLEEQVLLPKNLDALVSATLFILERLRDEGIVGEAGLDAFLQETMDYAKEVNERLPSIWDEVGPLVQPHIPQGEGPSGA